MSNVYVMDHPLIQHKISHIRQKELGSKDFRAMVSEIAMLMCYEATRDLKLKEVEIETPICKTTGKCLAGKKLAVVPILRAGLGMVEGMLTMIPAAKVGHIGLYRDPETLEPVEYYCKLPADCEERETFVVDPMLATGGSSSAAIRMLKEKGITVGLATNPIFPAIATESRIRWAGLDPEDFAFYTTYENIGLCKPNPDYYREAAARAGVSPEECLMVGNDIEEDMVACEKAGMRGFLLTDCLIDRKGTGAGEWPNGGFCELASYIGLLLAE